MVMYIKASGPMIKRMAMANIHIQMAQNILVNGKTINNMGMEFNNG